MNEFRALAVHMDTLSFLRRHWRTILRLTWVPFSLMVAAGIAVSLQLGRWYNGFPVGASDIVYNWDRLNPHFSAAFVLQAPMMAVIAVAVHRLVLFGHERTGEAAPFNLGKTEVTYLFMGALLAVAFVVIDAIVFAPFYFLSTGTIPTVWEMLSGAYSSIDDVSPSLSNIAYILAGAAIIVVLLRSTVWPASLVARESLSWQESWALTQDKLWPMLVLFVLASLAVFAMQLAIVAPAIVVYSVILAFDTDFLGQGAGLLMSFAFSIGYVIATVFLAALASFAYKALRGYRPDEPIPTE